MSTSVDQVGEESQRLSLAYKAATRLRRLNCIIHRRTAIRQYLATAEAFAGLQVGAGTHRLDGWLATDPSPAHAGVVYVDTRKRLPFGAGTFDYVVADHVIEYSRYEDAVRMLGECHRVLKDNGVLRISTPNLLLTHQLMSPPLTPVLERYVVWSNANFGGTGGAKSAIHVVNRLQRDRGRQFLYDPDTLISALRRCGFSDVIRCSPGESAHPVLKNVDYLADGIGEEFSQIESLVVEATK